MLTLNSTDLQAVALFAATKDAREQLNGVHILKHGDNWIAAATNGHFAAFINLGTQDEAGGLEPGFTVPMHVVATAVKMASKLRPVRVNRETCGGVLYSPIDRQYPDVLSVVPRAQSGEAAQYDADLITVFGKAAKFFGRKGASVHIGHNGLAAASVTIAGVSQFYGILMPRRSDGTVKVPTWLAPLV